MIRLEGATLPREAQGAIPPILFGDLLRDVPGIPLQVGWSAVLADNCGIEAATGPSTLRLGGADLAETLAAVPPSGVVQLENEWLHYTAILADPPRLTGVSRGYRETVPAVHAKGTTVYFVETRPLYALAYVPPGCRYPDDAVVQLRVNDNAETPPATVRLQDERVVPGVRLVTVEFDASRAFVSGMAEGYYATGPRAALLPSRVSLIPPPEAPTPDPPGSWQSWMGPAPITLDRTGPSGGGRHPVHEFHPGRTGPTRPPPPPRFAPRRPAPSHAPFATLREARTVSLRQGGALGSVTADLRGLRDTPAGRYSGVGLAPLVAPTAIVRLLLEETYGETDPGQYHAPTWAATAAAHAARALTWRLVWASEAFEPFREAAQLCGQADLYLDDEGRWRYAFRDPLAPAVATLTARELLEEPGLAWTAGRDVITELEVAWGAGLQGGTFTLESPAMRVRHGRQHGGVTFPYAATESIARHLGQYQLRRRDRPRQSVTVRACHATLGLTLADKIHLDTPLLARYAEPTVPFEIVGLTDRGDQRVLVCLEADPLALEVFGIASATAAVAGSLAEADHLLGTSLGTALLVGALTTAAATELAGALAGTGTGVGDLTLPAAGPTFVNALAAGDASTGTPTVVTFTTGAGANYAVFRWYAPGITVSSVVGVPTGGGTTRNLASLGGVAFSRGMWGGVVSPAQEYTVTITWSGSTTAAATLSAYAGVGSVGTAATGSSGSLSVVVGATPGLVVDFAAGATADQNFVPGAGQTAELAMTHDGTSDRFIRGSYKAGSGTVDMAWTSPATFTTMGIALIP